MKNKVAFINVREKRVRVKDIEREDLIGPVDWGLYCHLELYKSYKYPIYDERNVLCIGMGKLAGSILPGSHRLIGCFRSPLTGGFFISTMGGAAYTFRLLGIDFLTIEGRSDEPCIVILKGLKNGIEYRFETITKEELFKIYRGYEGDEGVYALSNYLMDKFSSEFKTERGYMSFRILTVGPAAINTNNGAIFSAVIRGGKVDRGTEDWMARGGGGSVLYRAHGVIAIIFGGDNDWRKFPGVNLRDPKEIDRIFEEKLGKTMREAIMNATIKYRYNQALGTGGTFGSNFVALKDRTLMFNWTQIYLDRNTRQELYTKLVSDHYLAQFNEAIIKKRSFKTCGEPCPAVCKKVRDKYKVDYEPYSANGTLCGIFDFYEANKAIHTVDAMGFDAIEFGNTAAWLLEAVSKGLLNPEEVGISADPSFDPKTYKIEDSAHNARLVSELAKAIAYGNGTIPKIIGENIRKAAKRLDELFKDRVSKVGIRFTDLAVYVPFGKEGSITPCQYWDPAFFVPLPLQGTFMTRYHAPFMEPEEFARECLDRLAKELLSENNGFCRFHRGWYEAIAEILIEKAYNMDLNLIKHNMSILHKIIKYNSNAGATPTFWEGERVIDIIYAFVKEEAALGNEIAKQWLKKFEKDKWRAAKEYWERFLNAFREALEGK